MLGYSWKRVRHSIKHLRDPLRFNTQKEELNELKLLHDSGYIDLYFGDESHFGLVPNIPYAWQKKENPITLPAAKGKKLNVLGLMTRDCRLFAKAYEQTIDTDTAICFLDEFVGRIKKRTIVVLDNAPIHRSRKFKEKIKFWQEQDLYIYFLPPYSPELNLIEILWRFMKYQWLPFDAFTNFQNLKERVNQILQGVGLKYIINYI